MEIINKICCCLWKPLRIFGSCWTRIPGWTKHGTDWTDAARFTCTVECRHKLFMDIEGLVITRKATGSTDIKPGSGWKSQQKVPECHWHTWECRRNPWKYWWEAWGHLKSLWSSLGKTSCFETLPVCMEITDNPYCSTIIKTHEFSVYSQLSIHVYVYVYSYPSTHSMTGWAAGGAWEQFKVHLKMTMKWIQRYTLRL